MNILTNLNGSESEDETRDRSLTNEAQRVVNEIQFGIEKAYVSEKLVSNHSIAFINIRTLEKEEWCIQLTANGYSIVGNTFDSVTMSESAETYETVEALMNRISPKYMKLFNESVAAKLRQFI